MAQSVWSSHSNEWKVNDLETCIIFHLPVHFCLTWCWSVTKSPNEIYECNMTKHEKNQGSWMLLRNDKGILYGKNLKWKHYALFAHKPAEIINRKFLVSQFYQNTSTMFSVSDCNSCSTHKALSKKTKEILDVQTVIIVYWLYVCLFSYKISVIRKLDSVSQNWIDCLYIPSSIYILTQPFTLLDVRCFINTRMTVAKTLNRFQFWKDI